MEDDADAINNAIDDIDAIDSFGRSSVVTTTGGPGARNLLPSHVLICNLAKR